MSSTTVVLSFPSQRVTIAPDVLFRLVGEEAVLLNLKTELYLGLDPVGARMWRVLADSPSIEAAFQSLLAEYDVEGSRLRADVEEFIGKLIAQQLVLIESSEASATT